MDEFTKWLQSRLTSHGFPPGPVDGIMGGLTTRALQVFQANQGLPVSGLADPRTVTALRATSSGTNTRPKPEDDADLPLTANAWPTQREVPAFFGKPGGNLQTFELPYPLALSWDKTSRVRRMTLHAKVGPSAMRVLEAVSLLYNERERSDLGLDLFGGSYNYRVMRGGSALSMHAYGVAIDFDPVRNGLKIRAPKARLSHTDALPWWRAWENEGWVSLGRARDFDWMHVQAARL
jgi:peptidoglycan hydrolase-like protein with peptidoglycan-binding domain